MALREPPAARNRFNRLSRLWRASCSSNLSFSGPSSPCGRSLFLLGGVLVFSRFPRMKIQLLLPLPLRLLGAVPMQETTRLLMCLFHLLSFRPLGRVAAGVLLLPGRFRASHPPPQKRHRGGARCCRRLLLFRPGFGRNFFVGLLPLGGRFRGLFLFFFGLLFGLSTRLAGGAASVP